MTLSHGVLGPPLRPLSSRKQRSPFKSDHDSSASTIFTSPADTSLVKWFRRTPLDSSSSDVEHDEARDSAILHALDVACALTPLHQHHEISPVRRLTRLNLHSSPIKPLPILSWNTDLTHAFRNGAAIISDAGESLSTAVAREVSNPINTSGILNEDHSPTEGTYTAIDAKSGNSLVHDENVRSSPSSDAECSNGHADQTIYGESSDSDSSCDDFDGETRKVAIESMESVEENHGLLQSTPAFISSRKRHLHEFSPASPVADHVPNERRRPTPVSIPHIADLDTLASYMPVCHSSTGLISASKLSFSFSDSTPCPIQPKRKKSRFLEPETTPLNTTKGKRLLNLARSIRTNVDVKNSLLSFGHHDHYVNRNTDSDESWDVLDNEPTPPPPMPPIPPHLAAPVSQSTPANSRPSTPPDEMPPTRAPLEDTLLPEASMRSPNASTRVSTYDFVAPPSGHAYCTPKTLHPSLLPTLHRPGSAAYMRAQYVRGDLSSSSYRIEKEVPVSSAGLMDESRGDVHIGDKRIGDPYLATPQPPSSGIHDRAKPADILHAYNDQFVVNLPLPPPIFYMQHDMPKADLLQLVHDPQTIAKFYRFIVAPSELRTALKADRVKWHPDKWAARFREQDEELLFIDMDIVVALAQLLNFLVDKTDS